MEVARPGALDSVDRALIKSVKRARRGRHGWALLAVLPALLFIALTFAVPIAGVLYRAVESSSVRQQLPRVSAALEQWDGTGLPGEDVYRALGEDIHRTEVTTIAELGRELNNRLSGFRSLLIRTKRDLDPARTDSASFQAVDERWGQVEYLHALRAATRSFTPYYILAALDLRQSPEGWIERAPEDRRIYLQFVGRTFWICFVVTLCCALIGYPVAYQIAQARPTMQKILLFALLIPFWTSVLVRTAAWVIVLQKNGIVNSLLLSSQLISDPLTLIYNRFGVYVAMIHVLMPFMILPIYSVMKTIPTHLLPAASSLGAPPFAAFREVYLPLSLPGLSAGTLMTFVLGLGYYVTPALVGGATDQMESGLIAHFALDEANWAMASAIALVLLALTAVAYFALRAILRVRSIALN